VRILVLNAGSSSLKASVLDTGDRRPLAQASVGWGSDATRVADRAATVERALVELDERGAPASTIDAVGHRMVHGGEARRQPTLIDGRLLAELAELTSLAPLHNTVALDTIRATSRQLPDKPQAVAFDTGFHGSLPPDAFVYPLPWQWHEQWGVRRYGFHGLSVEWSVRRAAELLGRAPTDLNLIVAHLGNGCSVTAVGGGRSLATSMGLTPLEGLMMGTRAGSVDPGIMLELLRSGRLSVERLAEALDHESGLLGISGISGDVREVGAAAEGGDRRAALALAIFARRAAEGIAAAATALPRLEALVFTGGIGENAGALRADIVRRLTPLGVDAIDPAESGEDRVLNPGRGRVSLLRVEAREDVVIAEAVEALTARLPRP
jgi:acetate kinase